MFLTFVPQPVPHLFTEGLARPIPAQRRSIVHMDPVEEQIVRGTFAKPSADGTWQATKAGSDGVFSGRGVGGGYVYFNFKSTKDQVLLLAAQGHTMVYINGEPRAGDPYSFGYLTLPVRVKKGDNSFLFLCGRGRLRAELKAVSKEIEFDLADLTTPDLYGGEIGPVGVVVRNNTTKARIVECGGQTWALAPLTVRKLPLNIKPEADGTVKLDIKERGKLLDSTQFKLAAKGPNEARKMTFLSQIDGSAQYFGLLPASTPGENKALVLSLHGASVEAIGQAQAYGAKSWLNLAAATNRRPFGFDWEDVGRLDAIEVLETATKMLKPDPTRVYLTGHSMGGHGTWQVGAHYPDRFAAIAPCSGWESMFSYAGTPRLKGILEEANRATDTLRYVENYRNHNVFILHGSADDNVPATEARNMHAALTKAGLANVTLHEEPGQGHWYDTEPGEPGANCIDHHLLFDTFAKTRIAPDSEQRTINFTSANPGVNGRFRYLSILSQLDPSQVSTLKGNYAPISGVLSLATGNVRVLRLTSPPKLGSVELDGQKLPVADLYERSGDKWAVTSSMPQRPVVEMGGFRSVLQNRVAFIYGTKGNAAENAWAYAKARYDAETFYYRGNAGCLLLPDTQVSQAPGNTILYGNERTNRAWPKGLPTLPSTPGSATFRIAPGGVGLIGGPDLAGMKLCDRVPLFTAGCGMPDYLVYGPDVLSKGIDGVLAAGYFDDQWRVIR